MLFLTVETLDCGLSSFIFELKSIEYLIHIFDLIVFLFDDLVEGKDLVVTVAQLSNFVIELCNQRFYLFALDTNLTLIFNFLRSE